MKNFLAFFKNGDQVYFYVSNLKKSANFTLKVNIFLSKFANTFLLLQRIIVKIKFEFKVC